MKVTSLILAVILFTSVKASDLCPKNKDPKSVAKDLITIEMSGIRLLTGAKEECLKNDFKEYRFNHDPDYDAPKNLEYILYSKSDIKVDEIKVIDKEVYQYQASYHVNAKDLKGNKVIVKDKITFMLNTVEKAQKVGGCAVVIEPPEKQVLIKSCKK